MTQHGFARDHRFDWVEQGTTSCKLVLVDTEAHKAIDVFYITRENAKLNDSVIATLHAALLKACSV